MKDQYFADFGDYQKCSLLKLLQDEDLRVLVHWMKTKDDGSTDGKHISYLQKPEVWREYDPEVFDFLQQKIGSTKRSLTHIEQSSFCANVQFLSGYIESPSTRTQAQQNVIESTADVVLFDPDNGVEVASTNKNNLHKYVVLSELSEAFASGKSIIVYQHFPRVNREMFIQAKLQTLKELISAEAAALQVRHSVYFFLMQNEHKRKLQRVIDSFSKVWGKLGIKYVT